MFMNKRYSDDKSYWNPKKNYFNISRVTGAASQALPKPEGYGKSIECGGKFCELRGCEIIGSCQYPSKDK